MYSTTITAAQLTEQLHSPTLVVIDCRFSLTDPSAGAAAYSQGHLPGAHYAHLDHDLASPIAPTSGRHPLPDPQRLAQCLGSWGVNSSSQVVAYDDANGAVAARLWWLLRWLGHDNAAVLDGGLQSWRQLGGALTTTASALTEQRFEPHQNDALWLTTDQLLTAMDSQSILIMDARAAERYRGESEPIDPIAGHIPGAINRPFQRNLDSTGCFLIPDQLAQQFEQHISPTTPSNVIHMCGSGVTACHNLLAMEIAGLSGSRLYAGSWSEWIRDAHRPIDQ